MRHIANAVILLVALFCLAALLGKRLKRKRKELEFHEELERIGRDERRELAYRRAGLKEVPEPKERIH
jgi:hypothetical protein